MSNAAVMDRLRSMVRVQVGFLPRKAQSPPQPRNSSPWSTAVSVMRWPGLNVQVQSSSQKSPPGPCTPAPPPGSNWLDETCSVLRVSKRTDAVRLTVIDSVHVVALPRQAPPQATTTKPGSGLAVSVTWSPRLYVAVQLRCGQRMPVPETLPLAGGTTVSVTVGDPKLADTVRLPLIAIVHGVPGAVPAQAPPQARWRFGAVGWAVRVTRWPGSNVAVQVPGQLMPFGPVTVPLTGRWTVSTGRVTGRFTTRIVMDAAAVLPPGNVAWTLTWYVRAAPHRCVARAPAAVWPSPKSHRAPVGCTLPGRPTACRLTGSPTNGSAVETAIRTFGRSVPGGGS